MNNSVYQPSQLNVWDSQIHAFSKQDGTVNQEFALAWINKGLEFNGMPQDLEEAWPIWSYLNLTDPTVQTTFISWVECFTSKVEQQNLDSAISMLMQRRPNDMPKLLSSSLTKKLSIDNCIKLFLACCLAESDPTKLNMFVTKYVESITDIKFIRNLRWHASELKGPIEICKKFMQLENPLFKRLSRSLACSIFGTYFAVRVSSTYQVADAIRYGWPLVHRAGVSMQEVLTLQKQRSKGEGFYNDLIAWYLNNNTLEKSAIEQEAMRQLETFLSDYLRDRLDTPWDRRDMSLSGFIPKADSQYRPALENKYVETFFAHKNTKFSELFHRVTDISRVWELWRTHAGEDNFRQQLGTLLSSPAHYWYNDGSKEVNAALAIQRPLSDRELVDAIMSQVENKVQEAASKLNPFWKGSLNFDHTISSTTSELFNTLKGAVSSMRRHKLLNPSDETPQRILVAALANIALILEAKKKFDLCTTEEKNRMDLNAYYVESFFRPVTDQYCVQNNMVELLMEMYPDARASLSAMYQEVMLGKPGHLEKLMHALIERVFGETAKQEEIVQLAKDTGLTYLDFYRTQAKSGQTITLDANLDFLEMEF
jgi:hypothetical protein